MSTITMGVPQGRSRFNAFLSIQHHPLNRLTSQSFKHKSLLAKLVEFLKQAGRP